MSKPSFELQHPQSNADPEGGIKTALTIYGIYRDNFGLALIGPISLVCVAVCVLTPSLSVSPGAATIVGGLTYPLYLLHQNIGYSVFARFGAESGRWSVGALLLLSLLFICWLIARFFEPLSRRFIKRWASAQISFGVHER